MFAEKAAILEARKMREEETQVGVLIEFRKRGKQEGNYELHLSNR